ncbi:MAG: hypothetical protein H6817_06315 [Phycisphaerales bacterium]|nr:hypothetical protein [Phycisphaerales bacterium]
MMNKRSTWIAGAPIVLLALAVCSIARAAGPAHALVKFAGTRAEQRNGVEQIHELRDALAALGFETDRCGIDIADGAIGVDVFDDADRERLRSAGLDIIHEDLESDSSFALRTAPQYYEPSEIAALLAQAAADHPAITHLFSVGTTHEGRTIWGLEISNNPGVPEDEPAIQFNGQHHSREVATCHVVMDVVEQLTNNYGTDPDITNWVNNYKTVCVPMVNPDGVQYVFDGHSSWRKNRMPYSCFGVDLNRNYPYLWGPGCGSSGTCTSDTYRGPSAASEDETQAMIALVDQYHFVMATSYHSYGQFIDYPYACATGAPATLMPEHAVIHEMMNGMADAIDSVDSTPRYDVNSPVPAGGVNGDDTSFYYAHKGVYAFIVEVGTSFEPSFSLVSGIVARNRAGWKYLYSRLGGARIDVHVTDECGGTPLEATVTLRDYLYDTGELDRVTFMPFGRWTFVTPPNDSYTVRATAPGYQTANVVVSVGTSPVALDIVLAATNPPPAIFGDTDCDGDVDHADFMRFEECFSGPARSPTGDCTKVDIDSNNCIAPRRLRSLPSRVQRIVGSGSNPQDTRATPFNSTA